MLKHKKLIPTKNTEEHWKTLHFVIPLELNGICEFHLKFHLPNNSYKIILHIKINKIIVM